MDVPDNQDQSPGAAAPVPLNYQTPPTQLRGPALRRALTYSTVAWLFGSVWLTAICGTPVTRYAQALKASEFQFGLLAALPFLASLLTLPASLLIEGTGQRKRIFLWGLYFQRTMWFPVALLPYWICKWYGMGAAGPAMVLFLWLLFLMHAGNAVGGPAWVSWMADIVPDRARGKWFSRRRQVGIISAIPTALLVGWLLDRVPKNDPMALLWWCGLIFMGAACFGVADIVFFHFVPSVPKEPTTGARLFKAWREPLTNPRFLWFAGFVATLVFAVSFMGQFATLYIMRIMDTGGGRSGDTVTQLMLIVVPATAQLLVLSIWGKAADRFGKRPLLKLGALGMVPVGLGWIFVTREHIWLGYVLSAAGAMLWAGIEIANFNVVLEVCGSTDENNRATGGSSYFAVNSVIINIAGCLGGICSGLVAQWLKDWQWNAGFKIFRSYEVLFALSAVMRFAAVAIFLRHVTEPAAKRTREAMRFMAANIYNNLLGAVLQPLRMLGLAKPESYEPGAKD